MKEIFANQISLNMNGDTLEIYVDNKIAAEISDGRPDMKFAMDVLEGLCYEINEDNFVMRPMEPAERNYTYRQSQQISMQTGLIGYLRADFGSNGKGFFSTWNDFRESLKTSEFKTEFDDVINSLRSKDALLASRESLSLHCSAAPEKSFGNGREYGVRVDTLNYSYLMRLNPNKGEYNLYCYCYVKEWLDRHLEKAERGIRFIDPDYNERFIIPDGDRIRITLSDGEQLDRTCRYIDDYHLEVGSELYHICQFAEIMQKNGNTVIPLRSSLPEQCFSTLPSTGELILITKGKSGYTPCYDFSTNSRAENREFANDRNINMGITKAQEQAMLGGSMFGWDKSAADPKNYDDKGNPIKPKRKNKDYER